MNLETFVSGGMNLEAFAAGLSDALNLEGVTLTAESALRALPGWDSLCMLNTIAYVDEVFGIVVTARQISPSTTVGDLWAMLSARA